MYANKSFYYWQNQVISIIKSILCYTEYEKKSPNFPQIVINILKVYWYIWKVQSILLEILDFFYTFWFTLDKPIVWFLCKLTFIWKLRRIAMSWNFENKINKKDIFLITKLPGTYSTGSSLMGILISY